MAQETSWAIVDSKTLLVSLSDQIKIDLLIIHTFHALFTLRISLLTFRRRDVPEIIFPLIIFFALDASNGRYVKTVLSP